jgi:arginine/lysine/ornithine decarboxylase
MKRKRLQENAPFVEELKRYGKLGRSGFHTPGHRRGRSLGTDWAESPILNFDLTEISGMDWEGALERASALAADFYRADHSFFLVQGATQGIFAALLGCFNPGDTILVARNCHGSVLNGLILAGLKPVYLAVDFLPDWDLPAGVNIDALTKAVREYPYCKGLIITNPTYQGIATRLDRYREIIGERLLLVDEAHGGHLEWSGISGYDAYRFADLWIHGTHKLLGSVTQTGMLHLNNGRIAVEAVKRGIGLVSTTSPSFILLAALDANRQFLANGGYKLFQENLFRVGYLKAGLSQVAGLELLDGRIFPASELTMDPWKLVFSCNKLGLTGYRMERILQTDYGIQVEYSDFMQATCFLAPWQPETDWVKLSGAIVEMGNDFGFSGAPIAKPATLPNIPPRVMDPRDAMFSPALELPLHRAAGQVAAAAVAPYPPGVPLLTPGELIGIEEIQYIEAILEQGGQVHGIEPRQKTIRCVKG